MNRPESCSVPSCTVQPETDHTIEQLGGLLVMYPPLCPRHTELATHQHDGRTLRALVRSGALEMDEMQLYYLQSFKP